MAVHTEEIQSLQGGFAKTIDEGAMSMVLDNLQKSQYQYPIKSTVRELASNAVDAIRERDNARAILEGKAKVEDFYIQRDGPLYKDSNFDPSYFSTGWLGNQSKAFITYEEGTALGKDRLVISDEGVGLGGKRMDGYFKLAWSSKRNNKKALGKFGIGAKAALSTGVPYYTVINRYNGKEFVFNVYGQKVDSIVPHLDLETGQANGYVLMYEGTDDEYKAYWKPTTKPNGLQVIVEVKKHKKQEVLDAVKSQLLYFDNIELAVVTPDGHRSVVPTKAGVLYEDDYLIVSDNNQYSKPHLVINHVNYGYVDFQELELEQKMGNVGIKVEAEDVSINPSRESVIWDELTKSTIQTRFNQASQVATKLLQRELLTSDFVQWLRNWASIKRSYGQGNTALSKLAGIVDASQLEPAFNSDQTLKASSVQLLFPGVQLQLIAVEYKTKGGKQLKKLKRTELTYTTEFGANLPVYYTNEKPSPTKLRYLATTYQQGFIMARFPQDPGVSGLAEVEDDTKWIHDFSFKSAIDSKTKDTEFTEKMSYDAKADILAARRLRVYNLMKASSVANPLSTVEVPKTFTWTADDEEEAEVEPTLGPKAPTITAEEKRKLEERVVAFTPRGFDYIPPKPGILYDKTTQTNRHFDPKLGDRVRMFEWQKVEPKLAQVQSLEGDDVYYGTSADEQALHFAALLSRPRTETNDDLYGKLYIGKDFTDGFKDTWGLQNSYVQNTRINYWGPKAPVTLLRVAQDQTKHYKAYKHINSFFHQVNDKTITMSTTLVQWHTARLIEKELSKLGYLYNYDLFDRGKADAYKKLMAYHKKHFVDVESLIEEGYFFAAETDAYNQLLDHQDKLLSLQLHIANNPEDTEGIAALSSALFGASYEQAVGVDLEIYNELQELVDYSGPIGTLLNEIPTLTEASNTGTPVTISPELEAEIRSYLSFKGL